MRSLIELGAAHPSYMRTAGLAALVAAAAITMLLAVAWTHGALKEMWPLGTALGVALAIAHHLFAESDSSEQATNTTWMPAQ